MSTCISYVGRSLLLVLSSLTFACGAPDADGGHQVSGVFESPGLRPLGGSSSSTIASAVQPWSIVTDATHAYFLSRHEGNVGRVVKVPLAGGAKVKLAEFNSARLNSLVRISTTLYFTSLSGRVHQMSVAGGHVSIIYDAMSNAYWPRGLAGSGSAFSEPQFFLSTSRSS